MLMPTAICEYWIAKVETASLAPNAPTNTPDNAADDCQRNAVFRRQVRRLLPSFAQTARDERVYTHACADADRNDQHLERIDERDRRKRILRILRDKDAVDDVVQRVDDHGDHRRERHRKDQRPHFRGSHFVLLFQIYPP